MLRVLSIPLMPKLAEQIWFGFPFSNGKKIPREKENSMFIAMMNLICWVSLLNKSMESLSKMPEISDMPWLKYSKHNIPVLTMLQSPGLGVFTWFIISSSQEPDEAVSVYRWRKWGSEKFSHLLSPATQPASGRGQIWTKAADLEPVHLSVCILLLSLCSPWPSLPEQFPEEGACFEKRWTLPYNIAYFYHLPWLALFPPLTVPKIKYRNIGKGEKWIFIDP